MLCKAERRPASPSNTACKIGFVDTDRHGEYRAWIEDALRSRAQKPNISLQMVSCYEAAMLLRARGPQEYGRVKSLGVDLFNAALGVMTSRNLRRSPIVTSALAVTRRMICAEFCMIRLYQFHTTASRLFDVAHDGDPDFDSVVADAVSTIETALAAITEGIPVVIERELVEEVALRDCLRRPSSRIYCRRPGQLIVAEPHPAHAPPPIPTAPSKWPRMGRLAA